MSRMFIECLDYFRCGHSGLTYKLSGVLDFPSKYGGGTLVPHKCSEAKDIVNEVENVILLPPSFGKRGRG